jgi:L-lactate dehydrogenase complex protein LldE
MNEVYFYATCLVDLFYPDAGMAGIQLLRQAGVQVIFPEGQTCCGQPAFNCGYWPATWPAPRSPSSPGICR